MCKSTGFISLVVMMIVGAIGAAVAVGLLVSSIYVQQTALTNFYSVQARALVDTCTEAALLQIRNSASFTGSATINSYSFGTCTYTVTNTGGQNRLILASSTVSNVIRKVKTTVNQVTPTVTVNSWLETGDF